MEQEGGNGNVGILKSNYGYCFCPKCSGTVRPLNTIMRHCMWKSPNNQNESEMLPVTDHEHILSDGNEEELLHDEVLLHDEESVFEDDDDEELIFDDEGINANERTFSDNEIFDDSEVIDDGERIDDDEIPVNEQVIGLRKHILRIIESKIKYGWSREEALRQLLSLYNLLRNDQIPYQNWNSVLKFLKDIGYHEAEHCKVCICDDHIRFLNEAQSCPICGKEWKNAHDYYLTGIRLKRLFLNKEIAMKILSHWKNKESWFKRQDTFWPKRELWHGERFKELSYFWDKDNLFQLPVLCSQCNEIISVEEVNSGANCEEGQVVSCKECGNESSYEKKFARGNPLNQVFIFHEDGFNAFLRKSRGIAAISLVNGCCEKISRAETHQIYSFIPSKHLPSKLVHKFDAFFEPLIQEMTKLYIHGEEISIDEEIRFEDTVIAAGKHTVRALLILGTADIKAHAEMLLYASGGKCGCRRCLVQGTYVPEKRHYYYSGFRERYRFPAPARTAQQQYIDGLRCDEAMTEAERKRIQTETGICGVSVLFKLFKLYHFNPVEDMVIDRMHLCFNMLKREVLEKIWADLGENLGKEINDRDPSQGGLINREEFKAALEKVKWTREQKASGCPKISSLSDKLGGWKSDDYLKFSLVAPTVVAGRIPSKAYDCFELCCSIAGMLYNKHLRNFGWMEGHVKRLSKLIWSHSIKAEEFYGTPICTENLEYSVHMADDILRHSSPDNFSCEFFERSVKYIKEQKHNAKGIEKTYYEREAIRIFLSDYQVVNGPLYEFCPEKFRYRFDIDIVEERPLYLNERSFEAASKLLKDLHDKGDQVPQSDWLIKSGVLLGSLKRKFLTDNLRHDVKQILQRDENFSGEIPQIARMTKSLVKYDTNGTIIKFSEGDACIIVGGDQFQEQWTLELKEFILIGPHNGKYYIFFDGIYYIPAFNAARTEAQIHPWTKTLLLVKHDYNRGRLQLSHQIKRKVILYPEPEELENPSYYLAIDFDKQASDEVVQVPVFPVENDFLSIQGTGNETWYGRVVNVNTENNSTHVRWCTLDRHKRLRFLDQSDTVFFSSIKSILEVRRSNNGFVVV